MSDPADTPDTPIQSAATSTPESNPEPAVLPPTPPTPPPVAKPTSTKAKRCYFKKVLANMAFFVNGQKVPFEMLDQNLGVAVFEEGTEFAEGCASAAKAKRGGIVLIDEQIYDDLKKKYPFTPFAPKLKKPRLSVFNQTVQSRPQNQPSQQKSVVVAAGKSSTGSSSEAQRVGLVGGGEGAGGAGTPSAPQPFAPATVRKPKAGKAPVIKRSNSRSLEGGVPEE